MVGTFDTRLASEYAQLSERMRQAADYITENRIDIVTRSLRSVSSDSDLAPATFSRLAKSLGYESFEDIREEIRTGLSRQVETFSSRAERLQQEGTRFGKDVLKRYAFAATSNIDDVASRIDPVELERCVDALHNARSVWVIGQLGSAGFVEYLVYQMHFIYGNWNVAGRAGWSLGAGLSDLGERDALIVLSMPPFSSRAMAAAKLAKQQGCFVMVVSDTPSCPAFQDASARFLMPTDSPNFFSSYVSTVLFIETIVGMLVVKAGPKAQARISRVEENNRCLEEVQEV